MPILLPLKVHKRKSQAKEIKMSLKQKGIAVTVKPTGWIEVVEVFYMAMQAPGDNADYCITHVM